MGEDAEPEVEVPAEAAPVHLAAQVAVGGGEDARLQRQRAGSTHALEDAILQK